MAFSVDPHLLVVMMRLAWLNKQNSFPRRLDPKFHTLEHGIIEDYETNIRTFPVLDAIASISVRDDQHEVIAVALQLHPVRREIRLTIAGNAGVSSDLVEHLTNIWGKLRTLSNRYEQNRGLDVCEPEGGSPEIPAEVALSFRVAIFRDIYKYSFKKQMQRVKKWRPGLALFVREFASRRRDQELKVYEQNIWDAASGLLMFLELTDEIGADPEEITEGRWETMFLESISTSEGVKLALACKPEIAPEILAHELTGMPLLLPITAKIRTEEKWASRTSL